MYINVSLYLLQLNILPVPTSIASVTANTVIVLCVPPVRNVHKCQSILITTEQLTGTDQYSYSYTDTNLCLCQELYVFSKTITFRTGPLPRCQGQKFKPTALCTISVLRCFYILQIHYFIWQLSAPTSCSPLRRITVATLCRQPTRAADWQRGMTSDSCQIKCGCNPYMIRALASVSELCSYIISLQLLCLKFVFCFNLCLKILLLIRLSSGSAQFSCHLRPDLLSTLFLSTLSPISSANTKTYSHITVCTAVQISHCIILHFVSLNSYSPLETCLKYKFGYLVRKTWRKENTWRTWA